MEANGNTSASPYHLRCGDGDLEDQEEDINQIVAEIKMSLNMGLSWGLELCRGLPAQQGPSRYETRPKSLNLPPEAKHCGHSQRGFKPKTRTPEERLKWPHEQVFQLHVI
ncbi:amyloid-beta A4 precursor protein-binding family A member 2-like isoform X2 [Cebus imitator]|uniref:amyloid-beta A4 precursor protein-binding family A member 2-like isoform X2 n=1 Tax=Cebus imitator TaxID=2715852 RepID=UPI001896B016|nr:amyloid-beta A4 precursor protein-binding family A member 2-like isoform X2 [Cebus imitator]